MVGRQPTSTLFPYTTLFRSVAFKKDKPAPGVMIVLAPLDLKSNPALFRRDQSDSEDRKSTRLLQSHSDLVCRLLLEKKNARPQHPAHRAPLLHRRTPLPRAQ